MTLLVFLGVLVGLLILRLLPSVLVRLAVAVPPYRLMAMMRWMRSQRIGIALPRTNVAALSDAFIVSSAPAGGRLKFVFVSSSLLVLAVLATTAFWTWHSTGLMLLLR